MHVAGQDETCPAFGADFARGQASLGNKGFWLNFDTPAQCRGIAVQWQFCYYVDYTNDEQQVYLRVYRKMGANYMRVVEDIIKRDYTALGDLTNYAAACDGGDPPYCCENFTVAHAIEKNDIIGVCMRDAGKHDPLYSLDAAAPGQKVYQYMDTDDCNKKGDINTFALADLSQTPSNDFGLHAYLQVTSELTMKPKIHGIIIHYTAHICI